MLKYALMRWKIVFLIICFAGVLPWVAVMPVQAQDLLGQINGLRAQQGLPGFSINGALSVAAQSQAQWIVDNQNVSHTRPDGSGPRTRALAAGYPSLQISENIYGGTNASAADAWVFWLNSGIHYASLVSPNYQEIGIGIVNGGRFNAYVLVFGGVGAPPPAPNSAGNSGGGGDAAAAAAPPAYLGGADEFGNLKHIVQPGDTLGDIALIYGYTWDDLSYMMQLNGLGNVRDLEVGSTFLVPPHEGTYTPAPGQEAQAEQPQIALTEPAPAPTTDAADAAPIATTDPTLAAITAIEATAVAQFTLQPATITPFVQPTSPPAPTAVSAIATADSNVQPPSLDANATSEGIPVAAVPTQGALRTSAATMTPTGNTTTWIVIALGVQVIIVVGAGIEFGRRALKKRK